jgi:hypothetical protein
VPTVRTANATRLQFPGRFGAVNSAATNAAPTPSSRKATTLVWKLASEPGPSAGSPREAPRTRS